VEGRIVARQGLIAHGRGEAFDYLLGERTLPTSFRAILAASAVLLEAKRPVLSVNGNTAALVGKDIVKLSLVLPAKLEVNLFHRSLDRERAIANLLKRLGARDVLGVGSAASGTIRGIASLRSRIDRRGIGSADVVLVPLEDGDRAEALKAAGKTVVAIDLNPLSRTSQVASVSIIDNVVRAIPELLKTTTKLKKLSPSQIHRISSRFDNRANLNRTIQEMIRYLEGWLK
jgi:4-phosphopantoate--beta-alanine ligase